MLSISQSVSIRQPTRRRVEFGCLKLELPDTQGRRKAEGVGREALPVVVLSSSGRSVFASTRPRRVTLEPGVKVKEKKTMQGPRFRVNPGWVRGRGE